METRFLFVAGIIFIVLIAWGLLSFFKSSEVTYEGKKFIQIHRLYCEGLHEDIERMVSKIPEAERNYYHLAFSYLKDDDAIEKLAKKELIEITSESERLAYIEALIVTGEKDQKKLIMAIEFNPKNEINKAVRNIFLYRLYYYFEKENPVKFLKKIPIEVARSSYYPIFLVISIANILDEDDERKIYSNINIDYWKGFIALKNNEADNTLISSDYENIMGHIVKDCPGDKVFKLNLALAKYFNGNSDFAEKLFKEMLSEARYPDPEIYFYLGLINYTKGNFVDSKSFFEKYKISGPYVNKENIKQTNEYLTKLRVY